MRSRWARGVVLWTLALLVLLRIPVRRVPRRPGLEGGAAHVRLLRRPGHLARRSGRGDRRAGAREAAARGATSASPSMTRGRGSRTSAAPPAANPAAVSGASRSRKGPPGARSPRSTGTCIDFSARHAARRGEVPERSNGAVLKTVGRKPRGFESHPLRHQVKRGPGARRPTRWADLDPRHRECGAIRCRTPPDVASRQPAGSPLSAKGPPYGRPVGAGR